MVIDMPRLPGVLAPREFHGRMLSLPEGGRTMRLAWS
jgi:hypothetical protein